MKGASFKAGAGTIQSAPLPVPALELGPEPEPGPEPALLVPGLDAASSQAIVTRSPQANAVYRNCHSP
jgi:hypothetical protein